MRLNFSTIEGSRFSLWNCFFGNRDYLVGVGRTDSIDILAERNWFENRGTRELETDSIEMQTVNEPFFPMVVEVIEPDDTGIRRIFRNRRK